MPNEGRSITVAWIITGVLVGSTMWLYRSVRNRDRQIQGHLDTTCVIDPHLLSNAPQDGVSPNALDTSSALTVFRSQQVNQRPTSPVTNQTGLSSDTTSVIDPRLLSNAPQDGVAPNAISLPLDTTSVIDPRLLSNAPQGGLSLAPNAGASSAPTASRSQHGISLNTTSVLGPHLLSNALQVGVATNAGPSSAPQINQQVTNQTGLSSFQRQQINKGYHTQNQGSDDFSSGYILGTIGQAQGRRYSGNQGRYSLRNDSRAVQTEQASTETPPPEEIGISVQCTFNTTRDVITMKTVENASPEDYIDTDSVLRSLGVSGNMFKVQAKPRPKHWQADTFAKLLNKFAAVRDSDNLDRCTKLAIDLPTQPLPLQDNNTLPDFQLPPNLTALFWRGHRNQLPVFLPTNLANTSFSQLTKFVLHCDLSMDDCRYLLGEGKAQLRRFEIHSIKDEGRGVLHSASSTTSLTTMSSLESLNITAACSLIDLMTTFRFPALREIQIANSFRHDEVLDYFTNIEYCGLTHVRLHCLMGLRDEQFIRCRLLGEDVNIIRNNAVGFSLPLTLPADL